jgi:LL-diaminopimelate aminotransferase
MAGWRSAALLGHLEIVEVLLTMKTNTDSGHFLPVMKAAQAAILGDQAWVSERNLIYQERRDVVVKRLRSAGLVVEEPKASMYVWSPIPRGWKSEEFATAALENAYVSLTPGTVFGENGEGFVRISLTEPIQRLTQAMDRLIDWMEI